MAAAALSALLASTSCVPAPELPTDVTYEFALLGDNPYHPEDLPRFDRLIDDVNAHPNLEWVLHVGDVQGGQGCTDDLLRSRFELFQRFAFPFVYTPGDNDWFDCVREWEGSFNEYERLEFLRSVFFPDPTRTTGQRPLLVRSQALESIHTDFVENVLWTHGDVVYATVHLVRLDRPASDPDAAQRRMDAALDWIRTAFDVARDNGSSGVFIATQADPWIAWGLPGLLGRMCASCLEPGLGLEPLYAVLAEESTEFGRPVVVAVGDTHIFRVDKPLYKTDGALVENFTRVEAFGDPLIHWVRVTVDPADPQVFTFHQELVDGNVGVSHSR